MCACVNGVITNDMGDGRYQVVPCSCQEAERSREEHARNRKEWLAMFNEAYKLNQEGKWNGEAYNRLTNGRLHNSSTTAEVHEEIAS